MATFIAVVQRDGEAGYLASFPDYPACAVAAPTVDEVIARARAALLAHLESLLAANRDICAPMAADAVARDGALLLAAIEVPDDFGTIRVELDVPALSLARFEAVAKRHGLPLPALFIAAADRWAAEVPMAEPHAVEAGDVVLSDFGNPLELKVEAIAATAPARHLSAADQSSVSPREREITPDITAELARVVDEQAISNQSSGAKSAPDLHQRPNGRRR